MTQLDEKRFRFFVFFVIDYANCDRLSRKFKRCFKGAFKIYDLNCAVDGCSELASDHKVYAEFESFLAMLAEV